MFYLYLKTHNQTGLKYLGFTTKDPYTYKGSGTYWQKHLKEHGNDISTEILLCTRSFDELSDTGTFFSKLFNVAGSKDFANLCEEDGNKNFGKANPNFRGHSQTEETRDRISRNNSKYWKGKTGSKHPSFGKLRPDSVETAKKMAKGNIGRIPWNKGRIDLPKHSEETKRKMSEAKMGIPKPKIECPHCGKIGGKPAMIRFHFNNCKEK